MQSVSAAERVCSGLGGTEQSYKPAVPAGSESVQRPGKLVVR